MTNKVQPQTIVTNEDPALSKDTSRNLYPQDFQDIPPLTGTSNVNLTVNCINQNITTNVNYPYGQQYEVQFKNNAKLSGDQGLTYHAPSQTLCTQNLTVAGNTCLGPLSGIRINNGTPGYVLTTLDYNGNLEWRNPGSFVTSSICVGTVDSGNNYTNILSNLERLAFDDNSGFEVTNLGGGTAKIAMNSTFKCWEVNGSSGLIACGLDTVNFVAGSGVTITSSNTSVPKTLTISATGTSSGVSSLNSLSGSVTLSAGTNTAIGVSGNTLTLCNTYTGVTGINSLVGAVTLSAGNNISIGASGNTLTICSSGGGTVSPATPTTLGTTYAYNHTSLCNTFVGYCAGNTITTGFTNVAIGYGALTLSNNGECNIAIGNLSMNNTTCNSETIMIGHNAGENMTPDAWVNTGLGHRSFYCASTAFSIGVGTQSLYNAGGSYHIAIGDGALTNTSGYSNIGIGYSAGFCLTGTENLALGNSAMCSLTNSEYNTAVGMYSMMGSALNPFACFNTAVGYSSMDTFTTSINNVAIGAVTLRGGGGCIVENVAVGNYSLCCNRFGSKNIGLGYCAGAAIITGSNNTVIGSLTGTPGLVCTVLIGAGTCERIKVDDNGLCINGAAANTFATLNATTINAQNFNFTGTGPVSINSNNDIILNAAGWVTFETLPVLPSFTKSQLTALVGVPTGAIALCTNAIGGARPVWYNGTAWVDMVNNPI